jgi:hypothetical protein
VAVLAEGEFDAILLAQEAGDLVDVVTLGSASACPGGRWLGALRDARRILVCYDLDEAGQRGAAALAALSALSARSRPVRPVGGKDLTEMHLAGGDLRAWMQSHLARHAAATAHATPDPPAAPAGPATGGNAGDPVRARWARDPRPDLTGGEWRPAMVLGQH